MTARPLILITSALPYINGVKHLGNLVGSMLPADVYARYARAKGAEVLAVCATDEHGTPAELAAAARGMEVSAFCDEAHALQKALGARFGLSWDWFGRTSRAPNHELTRHFAHLLEEVGLIEEREDEQIYSPTDGRFLPDRYVEGTCPHCGHGRARGDQCDLCGNLLDPTDLKAPRSAISGATDLEVRRTRHLYLRQSAMKGELRAWIKAKTGWSRLVTSIAVKWLDDGEGLQDRSITRDLNWGVRVLGPDGAPRSGFEDKVFYVWFDAPIGYIAATREWAEGTEGVADDAWRRWWRVGEGAEDVTYVQFMAKDNIPFHTVGFPITLLGAEKAGERWKSADYIKGFNWLTWYGGKFSTSEKRGVFMDQALELLPADYWRWWLMANAPEGDDTSFTWERFQEQCNKDLADVLGNFVNRVCRFTASKFGEAVPEGGDADALVDGAEGLAARLSFKIAAYDAAMAGLRFREAAGELRGIWALANEFVTEAAPWTAFKTDKDQAAAAVRVCFNLIRIMGVLSAPFIPETAARLLGVFGIEPGDEAARWIDVGQGAGVFSSILGSGGVEIASMNLASTQAELSRITAGTPFTPPPVLFKKIEDADVAAWRERFGGE